MISPYCGRKKLCCFKRKN